MIKRPDPWFEVNMRGTNVTGADWAHAWDRLCKKAEEKQKDIKQKSESDKEEDRYNG